MIRQRVLRGLLTGTILCGSAAVASPAFAQDAAQPAPVNPPDTSAVPPTSVTTAPQEAAGESSTNAQGAPAQPQEIIVTGSRIPQPNLQTASPVTTVSSQEVKLSGTTRTEDLINALPQVFSDQGSNISNGSTGTATVNLRGLGAKRTMVLVNGKRLVGGDPRQATPDINIIPIQLVKRVDVLTGGARPSTVPTPSPASSTSSWTTASPVSASTARPACSIITNTWVMISCSQTILPATVSRMG